MRSFVPWLVIATIVSWAIASVALRKKEESSDGTITIRLAHWQLEAGVRDGFAEAIADYEALHPNVRIFQEAIPESTYGQWLSTQLMGGTAPDIVQAGMIEGHLMTAFYTRYFLPLSSYASRPNPYNAGTELGGVPLMLTFKDGMRRSFIDETQEFMNIPLALTGVRLFYNKDLLKKLTGTDRAPETFRAFLKACEVIRSQRQPNGQPYVAIAGSKYHYARWEESLINPLTYAALAKIDFNRDGRFSKDEMFLGFLGGNIDFNDPAYAASFKVAREITNYFPVGWTGLTRDEAMFNFAQEKAVFIATGTWEAEGIRQQAEGKFALGLINFPLPDKSDPEYGSIIKGPRYENPEGAMPMAITRTSAHPEVAADFLLFLVSREQNEKFNRRLKWIPIIIGAKIDPYLNAFEPTLEGVFSAFDASIGPDSFIRWGQLFSLYQIGQLSYADLASQFSDFYTTKGREDFGEFLRNRRRIQIRDEQLAVGQRVIAIRNRTGDSALNWMKYRNIVITRQLAMDRMLISQGRLFSDPEQLKLQQFYQYSPKALTNIREALAHPPANNSTDSE